jgi:hypothetical protein
MASNSKITPNEILAVVKKWPKKPLLRLDTDNVRDNSKGSKGKGKKKTITYYVNIEILRLSGKYERCKIRMENQIMTSNAKLPYDTLAEKAKHVVVNTRELTMEDLKETDYVKPNDKGKAALSEENLKALVDNHNLTCHALYQVHLAWLEAAEGFVEDATDHGAEVHKNIIFSFCQTHRKADKEEVTAALKGFELDNSEDLTGKALKKLTKAQQKTYLEDSKGFSMVDGKWKVAIEKPAYRMKVGADGEGGRLGYSSKDRGFQYVVFDARKSQKKAIPAKLRLSKKSAETTDLTPGNAKHFIRYMSLFTGTWALQDLCSSSMGISAMNKFWDISVWPHQKMSTTPLDEDDFNAMSVFGTTTVDDDDCLEDLMAAEEEEAEEKASTSKRKGGKKKGPSKKSPKKDEEDFDMDGSDDEPESNDDDDDDDDDDEEEPPSDNDEESKSDEEDVVVVPSPKKKSPAKKKSPPKRKKKSPPKRRAKPVESEPEEEEEDPESE